MRRYWISKDQIQGDQVRLEGEIFHHIFDVCRQEVGSKFEVLTGDDRAYFVEVTELGKKRAMAQVLEAREIPPLKRPHLVLVLSIPRFPKLETILEKSVELGVFRVLPVYSDHSFVRTEGSVSPDKLSRWAKIILGATQQCGRGELMALEKPQSLEKVLESFNRKHNALGLFSYEGACDKDVKTALREGQGTQPEEIWVFVGSEGGFSEREKGLFAKQGLAPITLGAQVLRVETACLVLLSVLKYEFDLMTV